MDKPIKTDLMHKEILKQFFLFQKFVSFGLKWSKHFYAVDTEKERRKIKI